VIWKEKCERFWRSCLASGLERHSDKRLALNPNSTRFYAEQLYTLKEFWIDGGNCENDYLADIIRELHFGFLPVEPAGEL
jgi:hypothetical protein